MPVTKKNTVRHLAWHRNGISGVGFYVALMDTPDGEMVVIRFPGKECRTAVLNVARLADTTNPESRIGFARGNSWRGDHYEDAMLKAIRAGMSKEDFDEFLADD